MPLPQASTGSASASAHSASVSAATAAYMSRQDFTHRAINFEEMLERENQRRRDIGNWQRQVNRVAPRNQGSARPQTDFQSDDLAALEFLIINRSLEAFHSPTRCPHCDTVLSGLMCTNDLCSNDLASSSSSVTIDRTGMLIRDQNGMVRVRSGTSGVGSHTHHINNASIQAGSITGRSIRTAWTDELATPRFDANLNLGINTPVAGSSQRPTANDVGEQIQEWMDVENEMRQSFQTWLNDNSSVGATGNTGGF